LNRSAKLLLGRSKNYKATIYRNS